MPSECSLSKLQQAVNRVSMVQHTCRLASAALRSVMLHIGLSLHAYISHGHSVPMANNHSITHQTSLFPGSHAYSPEYLCPVLAVSVGQADGNHTMLHCKKPVKGCAGKTLAGCVTVAIHPGR